MSNKMSNVDLVQQLDQEIMYAISEACVSESRNVDDANASVDYVVVRAPSGQRCFVPIKIRCSYNRVQRKFVRSIKGCCRFLDLYYLTIPTRHGEDTLYRFDVYENQFPPNHTIGAVIIPPHTETKYAITCVDLSDTKEGEVMPAWKYEKLVFTYWNIDADDYRSIQKADRNDKRLSLPSDVTHNWQKFSELYNLAFDQSPDYGYEIICSNKVERLL